MQVVAVIREEDADVLKRLLEATRQDAFSAGYQRATQDLLDWLVFGSEEFLRERTSATQELRKHLYSFVAQLERRIVQNRQEQEYVEGGLGI